jgi:hypothetical protein
MAKFKSIAEWLKSNPSDAEVNKVLILIHRGEANSIRKAVYEKEQYLRKLQKSAIYLNNVGIKPNKELMDQIKATVAELETLKKDLPISTPRARKVKTVVE